VREFRVVKIRVSPKLLREALKLPPDVRIIGADTCDYGRYIEFCLESENYPVVAESEVIPTYTAIKRLDAPFFELIPPAQEGVAL
jgi:hypothetical protein